MTFLFLKSARFEIFESSLHLPFLGDLYLNSAKFDSSSEWLHFFLFIPTNAGNNPDPNQTHPYGSRCYETLKWFPGIWPSPAQFIVQITADFLSSTSLNRITSCEKKNSPKTSIWLESEFLNAPMHWKNVL